MDAPDRRDWLWAAAAAALAVLFYHTHLELSRTQSGGDFANLFWPMKEFRRDAFAQGVFPLWIPYLFMGSPHAATLQHAVFHPVDWLFFTAGPVLPMMNLNLLAHLAFAAAGGWLWMRRGLGTGNWGALLAGAAWPCTAWFWGAQEHVNQVATIAYAPWLLGMAAMAARGRMRPAPFAAAYAALASLQFLVGHPQGAFYTHLGAGALLLFAWAAGPDRRTKAIALAAFAAAGMMTALCVSLQLLPALELSGLAARHRHDPAWSYSYSMPPDLLWGYLQPRAFGSWIDGYRAVDPATGELAQSFRAYNEYGVFVGVPVLLLALASPLSRRRKALAGLAIALAATHLMALGGNASVPKLLGRDPFTEFPQPGGGSIHDLVVALFPPAAGFRVPARVLVLGGLAWATLAGLGLDGLLRLARERGASAPLRIAVGAAAVGAAMAALYLPSRPEKFRHPEEIAPLALAIAEDPLRRAEARLDDRLFRLAVLDHELLIRGREQATEAELGAHPIVLRWNRAAENMNAVMRVPTVEGYEEGLAPPLRTKGLLLHANRNLRRERPDEQLLALLGVSAIFSDPPIDPEAFPRLPAAESGPRELRAVGAHRGAAFWAAAAQGIDFAALEAPHWPDGAYREIRNTEPIDFGGAPQWAGEWPRIAAIVANPNQVLLRADGPPPSDAILSMGHAPGWRRPGGSLEWIGAVHARIPKEDFDANGEVLLRYEPESFRIGLFLSALGLALAAATGAAGARRVTRSGRSSP